MDRILRGIMRYRQLDRKTMVEQFQQVKNNPMPKAVFFTCMDSRMIPTRFTEMNVGDMFIGSITEAQDDPLSSEGFVKRELILDHGHRTGRKDLFSSVLRNAGNVIPHSHHFLDEITSNEPAALELGCVINDIRHIIVCGHSDCKAINLLYQLQDTNFSSQVNRRKSPIRAWLCAHAWSSLEKFQQLELTDYSKPLIFQAETPQRKFVAYIDPENKLALEDKLSQINALQQLQNIASYGFLKSRLEKHQLHIHALWFDIYTGEIYYFSRQAKQFVIINEDNIETLMDEVENYYM